MGTETGTGPLLMVYGSLKRGMGNHDNFLRESVFKGEYSGIRGIMFHLGGFPAVCLREPRNPITGEIYQVPWPDMKRIDGLEGHPRHYRRISVFIPEFGDVFLYVYPESSCFPDLDIVPSGNWTGRTSPRIAWGGWEDTQVKIALPAAANEALSISGVTSRLPRCRFVPSKTKMSTDIEEWMDILNVETGELHGPVKILGYRVLQDGAVKPRLNISDAVKVQVAGSGRPPRPPLEVINSGIGPHKQLALAKPLEEKKNDDDLVFTCGVGPAEINP